ncbi:adenosylhomocysteinase [Candidatus Bathyarchaeota archaeon]|nr:MAG: adenosylhomocysteinase [Candidatus Bathyarchaeota archaeon]
MADFKVKDPSLAKEGFLSIEWAESRMPVLMEIRKEFEKKKPLKGLKIGASLHVTKETAVLVKTLMVGGAEVSLCASNPLSTQDEVAAALVEEGVNVYAWRGETTEEYYWCIDKVLSQTPNLTLDDGADLVTTIHSKRKDLIKNIVGGTEETTTGVVRIRAMAQQGVLGYPVIAVNDAYTKYLFDNRYGTGQSTIDGIMRATSGMIAGKNFVVVGYGWCGKGIAMRAKGMGANVVVVEVNPLRALEALMDGFIVTSMLKAAEIGDIFVTATGNINVITLKHFEKMKDGAILANSGHFNVEIDIPKLENIAVSKRRIRPNVDEYRLKDGRKLYLLAEGRLVNLSAAEGHPPEVMMMSFANQALCVEYLSKKGKQLKPKVYKVPEKIDKQVAFLALKTRNIKIDRLTKEQKKYLKSWEMGTT